MQPCRLTPPFSFIGRGVPALTSGASVVMGLPDIQHYFAGLWPVGNTGTRPGEALGNLLLESVEKKRKSPLWCHSAHRDGTGDTAVKHPAMVVSPIYVFTGYPSLVNSRKWKRVTYIQLGKPTTHWLLLDATRQHQTALHMPHPAETALIFQSSCLWAALAAKTQLPAFLLQQQQP